MNGFVVSVCILGVGLANGATVFAASVTSRESALPASVDETERTLRQASALMRQAMATLETTTDKASADKTAATLERYLREGPPLWLKLKELNLVHEGWFSEDPSLSANPIWQQFKNDCDSFCRSLLQHKALFSYADYYGSTTLRETMSRFFRPIRRMPDHSEGQAPSASGDAEF